MTTTALATGPTNAMQHARAQLGKQLLRTYKLRPPARWMMSVMGVYLVAHAWAVIAAAITLFALFPNPATYILAVMLIGTRQLGLAILMHDGAHHALARPVRFNNWLSDWLCAWPILLATAPYRTYHLQHHARTQQPDDPDLVLSAPFPITKRSLMRKIWRDLSGQTGISQRKAQFVNAWGAAQLRFGARIRRFARNLGPGLLAQAVLLGICAWAWHWSYYLWFWLVPLLTWNMLVTRIRNIAEHALVPDDNDPLRNARTTHAHWWERIFIAPYWVNYHVEHHLLMFVPCYRLPAVHKAVKRAGLAERMEQSNGYLAMLKRATCATSETQTRQRRQRLAGSFDSGFRDTTS